LIEERQIVEEESSDVESTHHGRETPEGIHFPKAVVDLIRHERELECIFFNEFKNLEHKIK
jgi:hypothetical protein